MPPAEKTGTLEVPGAEISYEVRGSGPVLLCIPGGPATAGVFSNLAAELAAHYSVLTYDPRGLSRSPLTTPFDDDKAISINADDASRLLAAVTGDRAYVLGSSGGAVIALELAARHGKQIESLVAHEAPASAFLDDPAKGRAAVMDVAETYRTAGAAAAFAKFTGRQRSEGRPMDAAMQSNLDFWFGHTWTAIGLYEPDLAALRAAPCRIVSGVGEDSMGQLANDAGRGLARMLGSEVTVFPGGHGGYDSHAPAFARKLREVFET